MIEYIEGDIFESPAQVIVNPVNTIGVMEKDWRLNIKKDILKCLKSINPFARKSN